MSYRNAESRLPPRRPPLTEADRKAIRAFCYGSTIFGIVGFLLGLLI